MFTNLETGHELSSSSAKFISTTRCDQKVWLSAGSRTDTEVGNLSRMGFLFQHAAVFVEMSFKSVQQIDLTLSPEMLARANRAIR
jgi:hypothetical protein